MTARATQTTMFGVPSEQPMDRANAILRANHYLGAASRGFAFTSVRGVMVFANPSSRRLPQRHWVELTRWCITSPLPNAASQHWAEAVGMLRRDRPAVTTVVSYSDPGVGHDGGIYRASGWVWAPTWLRLRPPPSGNGAWTSQKVESVKDRWVYLLAADPDRAGLLRVNDGSIMKKMPWAQYAEPAWRRNRPDLRGMNAHWRRFRDAFPDSVPQKTHETTCDMDDDCRCEAGAA